MKEYRISKYDPALRNNGAYNRDEWTSISDVGKAFEGQLFTYKEYEDTERRYIACILDVLTKDDVKELCIHSLEDNDKSTQWKNDMILSFDELSEIIRDCLREKIWCKLNGAHSFLHFGYDYYVYIGCLISYEDIRSICNRHHLFAEEMKSPYGVP